MVEFSSELVQISSDLVEISSELVWISLELIRKNLELLIISTFKKAQGGIPNSGSGPKNKERVNFSF